MEEYHYRKYNPGLRVVGAAFDILLAPLSLKRRLMYPPPLQLEAIDSTIAVFESHLIGDCVMTFHLLHSLRKVFPRARILLIANRWARPLLDPEFVDEFIEVKVPWATYDYSAKNLWNFWQTLLRLRRKGKVTMAVETRGDPRNALTLAALGAPFRVGLGNSGGASLLTHPVYNGPADALWENRELILRRIAGAMSSFEAAGVPQLCLAEIGEITEFQERNDLIDGSFLLVHPGASKSERRMPIQIFLEILHKLRSRGIRVVVAVGPSEGDWLAAIPMEMVRDLVIFKGSLRTFLGLTSKSLAAITMDSGPAHLAAWAGIPVLTLCSHNSPEVVKPFGKYVKIVRLNDWDSGLSGLMMGL